MSYEAIKILENTESNLVDMGCSKFFLDMSPEARETKTKINYWDYIKIKSFSKTKERINTTKRQLTDSESKIVNDISDKGSLSKIYKEQIKLSTAKTNNPVKNGHMR